MIWWLAENTLIAAVLALLVALVCRVWRAPPVIRHALWLVVLIRLIAPPILTVSLPFPAKRQSLGESHGAVTKADVSPIPDAPVVPSLPEDSAPALGTEVFTEMVIAMPPAVERAFFRPAIDREPSSVAEMPSPQKGIVDCAIPDHRRPPVEDCSISGAMSSDIRVVNGGAWRIGAFLIWGGIAGTLVAAVVESVRIVRMFRLLNRSRPAGAEVQAMVQDMAARMKFRPPQVRLSSDIQFPLICALGRAVLLWPESRVDEIPVTGRQAVVVHELAHVARRDHFVGWLELVAGCLWWWNPLFWYVRHQLRENAELACDAWVLGLFPEGRRAYAQALVDLAEFDSRKRRGALNFGLGALGVGALGVGESSRNLFERRLVMIMGDSVRYRLGAGGIISMGLLALAVLPGCSTGQASDEPLATESVLIATDGPDAVERLPVVAGAASQRESNDPFVPAGEAGPKTGSAAEGLPSRPIQATEPAAGLPPLSTAGDDALPDPKPDLPTTGGPANPPANSSEDRIKRLEDRLEAILTELRELKNPAKGKVRNSDATGILPRPQVPGAAQDPNASKPGPDYSLKIHRAGGAVATVALTRATYKLLPGRAQAIAAFLSENLNDEVEVRVKEDALQVTANNEDQARISQFIQLLQMRGSPAPKPSAPKTEPLSDWEQENVFDSLIPATPGSKR